MANEVFTMTIRVHDDGTVSLSGPLDNKTLCYGLLEAAKDAVRDHHVRKNATSQTSELGFDVGAMMTKR
jgi:hypothetical protein